MLNRPLAEILRKLGHDGSEILWPEFPEPIRRRSFHVEELQYVALSYGFVLAPFAKEFAYIPGGNPKLNPVIYTFDWEAVLRKYDGLLLREERPSHSVAWSGKEHRIYDPGNHYRELESFAAETFLAAIPC